MAVTTPCYTTREAVKRALDLKETARGDEQVDRAIESAARLIDKEAHRRFYPRDTTRYFDWPNWQYAAPWKLWFGQWDLVSATSVTSGGVVIPLASVIFRPSNKEPWEPYTHLELDRSTTAAFAAGATPQNSIAIAGTWSYNAETAPAGLLAAAVASTTVTTVTVTDGSLLGVGDLAVIDGERMLVTGRAAVTTGQTNLTGATTASAADNAIGVTDGTQVHVGEVLQIDSERLLIEDVTGNVVTVKRGWDGTVLATHAGGTVLYSYRLLTVARGQLGTPAATHSNGATVVRHNPPPLIRDLCLAEALNQVLQETSGYSRTVGGGDTLMAASGAGLADKWDEAMTAHGRRARSRAI